MFLSVNFGELAGCNLFLTAEAVLGIAFKGLTKGLKRPKNGLKLFLESSKKVLDLF